MIESLYAFLGKVGFHHPLHPALTHIPMGMVMGCFFFGLLAFYGKRPAFLKTSLHCSILALVFIVPTVLAGIFWPLSPVYCGEDGPCCRAYRLAVLFGRIASTGGWGKKDIHCLLPLSSECGWTRFLRWRIGLWRLI